MTFTPRMDEAIKLAAHLHRNQTRIDKNSTPYISHLVSVAMILADNTDDEDIIIAGLMHDSLEDVPEYTYEKLVEDCGERVAKIVSHVTEPLDPNKSEIDQLPWLTRKESYLKKLKEGGVESAMVSAADKIHNTSSLLTVIEDERETHLSRFKSSLKNRVWFHEQVLDIVKEKLGIDNKLTNEFIILTEKFKELSNKSNNG